MRYCNIIEEDAANGIGFRTTLFVSGCNFHCKNCFNQKAQDFNYGKEYTEQTESYILEQLNKPYIKGLSLLGGDPLWQDVDGLKQLRQLVQKVHNLGKTVWIWSGFVYENLLDGSGLSEEANERILLVRECDVFVDGLFEDDKKDLSLAWRGSRNQRVIDMNKTKDKVVLYCE
jgi:anaerobic ribonucleoside-triphosphate reductase activating protein